MSCRSTASLTLLVSLMFLSGPARAAEIVQSQTLSPDRESTGEYFGGSLAVDGTTLVVGAPSARSNGSRTGAVYLYELRGDVWVQADRLTASDPVAADRFGSSVALSGDLLAVAARRQRVDRRRRGAVYIFERHGGEWLEVKKLVSRVSAGRERPYGSSVLADAARVAVQSREGIDVHRRQGGAWPLDEHFPNRGALALQGRALTTSSFAGDGLTQFRRRAGGWVEQDTLVAPAGECSWGDVVSRTGRRMAVADPTDTRCPELQPGMVHVYRRGGKRWMEEARVQPRIASSFGVDVGFFGFSTALGDRLLLVKASDNTFPWDTGTVYVFERSGSSWIERLKLEATEGERHFGRALAVGDSHFFVSSPGERPGKVLIFRQGD